MCCAKSNQTTANPMVQHKCLDQRHLCQNCSCKPALDQQFSENSRRLWLFLGSVRGLSRKIPRKSWENSWNFFPKREMLQIVGFWAPGKANLPGTSLTGPCPHLACGVFLDIDSSSLLEFFFLELGKSIFAFSKCFFLHLMNPSFAFMRAPSSTPTPKTPQTQTMV